MMRLLYLFIFACLPAWVVASGPTGEIPPALAAEESRLMQALDAEHPDLGDLERLATTRAHISRALLQAGDSRQAADYLWSSLDLDPNQAQRWEAIGDLLLLIQAKNSLAKDSLNAVRDAYTRALYLQNQNTSVRQKLASVCLRQHRFDEALHHYQRIVSDSDSATEWAHIAMLASLYALLGKTDEGLAFFDDLSLRTADDRFVLALAVLLGATGQQQDAQDLFDAVAHAKGNSGWLRDLARRLRDQGAPLSKLGEAQP